jgi:NADPH-dependent 2,4-dienoyl-CoA reductase/sulfur reductase-like enzyme
MDKADRLPSQSPSTNADKASISPEKIAGSYDVILVGGGPASRILNKFLHIFDPDVRTLVIRDEERIVNHCGTPYIVEGVIPWEKGLISEKLVTQFGTPILVDPVVGGDPGAHEVETASGRRIGYKTLVFATGTDQVLPPIPGTNLGNVLKIRRTQDVTAAIERLAGLKRVTILGAGYIGIEFAVALRHLGKEVVVIEMASHVMGGRIDPAMAGKIQERLASMGIEILTGRRAAKILGDVSVRAVEMDGGGSVETDAVLSSVGVRPLIDYAPAFGLNTTRNGIVVDDFFATGVPDIFAVGDCIETRSVVTGSPVPGKLGSNAGQMARRLALNMAGRPAPYSGVVNAAVTKIAGLAYGGAGLSEADAVAGNIPVHVTRGTSSTTYENMPDPRPVEAKLVYRKGDLRLLGGEILGEFNPSGFVETLAQLVERGATLENVLTMSYSSHPELTPKTAKPYFVWASEPLLKSLVKSGALAVFEEMR